ncbi:MAG TPA: flagellar protein FlaG [Rhodocyclaceae bacterium]|nr:flagellar protein FlaG [Rhodocyclaceae bacterium]
MLNAQLVYSRGSASFSPFLGTGRPVVSGPADAAAKAAPKAADPAAEGKPTEQSTRELVKDMNKALQTINTSLEFSQDDETGWTVVKLIDRQTKEVVRQFPSEDALAIAHALDKYKGGLIQQSA